MLTRKVLEVEVLLASVVLGKRQAQVLAKRLGAPSPLLSRADQVFAGAVAQVGHRVGIRRRLGAGAGSL